MTLRLYLVRESSLLWIDDYLIRTKVSIAVPSVKVDRYLLP